MKARQILRAVAVGAVMASASFAPGFVSSASAALMVTFDPSGAGLGGSITPFNSDQQNGRDLARAVIDGSGNFTENGIMRYDVFNDGANNVTAASGLGSVYSLYLAFTGTGTLPGFNPASPGGATGSFSSVSYALFGLSPGPGTLTLAGLGADPTLNGATPGALVADPTTIGGILLATGGSGPTSVGINSLGVPTASVLLSLTQAGTTFFLAPPGIDGFSASFTNDLTNSQVVLNGGNTEVLIAGSFSNSFLKVPEPASLTLLGTGLLGLGAAIRRRSAKKPS